MNTRVFSETQVISSLSFCFIPERFRHLKVLGDITKPLVFGKKSEGTLHGGRFCFGLCVKWNCFTRGTQPFRWNWAFATAPYFLAHLPTRGLRLGLDSQPRSP